MEFACRSVGAMGSGILYAPHWLFVRSDGRGLLPRARPLPGRALVRREGSGFLHRLRPGAVRIQRSLRNPLEGFRDSARRLRQILRRRKCCQRAGSGRDRGDVRGRSQGQLRPPESRTARRDRRCRPGGQFHFGDRDFRGGGDDLRPAKHAAARRYRSAQQRRRCRRLPARRRRAIDQRPRDRQLFRHAAHRQLQRRRARSPSLWSAAVRRSRSRPSRRCRM